MTWAIQVPSARDHPRVCGECPDPPVPPAGSQGSSPRVRGMLTTYVYQNGVFGIIPACAGNARSLVAGVGRWPDHPRVCGECMSGHGDLNEPAGSSPRVRGMRTSTTATTSPDGIIPACAGNALFGTTRFRGHRDHPRVCGECPPDGIHWAPRYGSSPRVRGMQHGESGSSLRAGIIPACAGNA